MTVKMIDALNQAASTDGERYASCFTKDGILDGSVGVTKGRETIARHMQEYIDGGFHVEREGPVIQNGLFLAHGISSVSGLWMTMYELALRREDRAPLGRRRTVIPTRGC